MIGTTIFLSGLNDSHSHLTHDFIYLSHSVNKWLTMGQTVSVIIYVKHGRCMQTFLLARASKCPKPWLQFKICNNFWYLQANGWFYL